MAKLRRVKVVECHSRDRRHAWVPLGKLAGEFIQIDFGDKECLCQISELDTLVIDSKLLPWMEFEALPEVV